MGDKLSKYHKEGTYSSSGGPQDSSNESTLPPHSGGGGAEVNPVNMGNPMMKMSGGGKVPGSMGETDSGNPMMKMGGGSKAELPDASHVVSGPQGSMKAPLASKLTSKR